MNIFKEFCEIANQFDEIQNMPLDANNKQYDKKGFILDLKSQVVQLNKFFTELVPQQGGDASETYFTPTIRPKINQVAYFNLGHGFPKELFGGHYCYILKEFNTKMLVVPTTSVKHNSKKTNKDYEIDINIKDFKNGYDTRLQVSDVRCVDLQRLYLKKGIFDVITNQKDIVNELKRIILGEVEKLEQE